MEERKLRREEERTRGKELPIFPLSCSSSLPDFAFDPAVMRGHETNRGRRIDDQDLDRVSLPDREHGKDGEDRG
jgi:hypothetical protein